MVSALYNVHCILDYTVYCIMYSVQCILYNVHRIAYMREVMWIRTYIEQPTSVRIIYHLYIISLYLLRWWVEWRYIDGWKAISSLVTVDQWSAAVTMVKITDGLMMINLPRMALLIEHPHTHTYIHTHTHTLYITIYTHTIPPPTPTLIIYKHHILV